MHGGFGVNCNGRIICGAGLDSYGDGLRKVFEFSNDNFVEIKPLTTGRALCPSLYIPPALENQGGLLLVAGSLNGKDTMEYLMINNEFKSNHWRVCDDNLPCSVGEHQMNLLQNKLILTGGWIDGSLSNKVWQGNISFNQQLRVHWTPLPPMMESRRGHVAVVIQNKLFCIGGWGSKSSEYFSFETNRWEKGPELPSQLFGTTAVLTKQQNQCFLLGGNRGSKNYHTITLI